MKRASQRENGQEGGERRRGEESSSSPEGLRGLEQDSRETGKQGTLRGRADSPASVNSQAGRGSAHRDRKSWSRGSGPGSLMGCEAPVTCTGRRSGRQVHLWGWGSDPCVHSTRHSFPWLGQYHSHCSCILQKCRKGMLRETRTGLHATRT